MKPQTTAMRTRNIVTALFFSVCLVACNGENIVFEEHKECSDNLEWRASEPVTIKIPVQNNSEPYQLFFTFRYATGYRFDRASVRIRETDPSGESLVYDLDIPVRDAKGEFIGEKGFDIIDLEYPIDLKKMYGMHGDYMYTIEQRMSGVDTLHFAMEAGLILKKAPSPKAS
jgi:gliding motility-associated lipoprotein GldH